MCLWEVEIKNGILEYTLGRSRQSEGKDGRKRRVCRRKGSRGKRN
jgi:hypothetical protein